MTTCHRDSHVIFGSLPRLITHYSHQTLHLTLNICVMCTLVPAILIIFMRAAGVSKSHLFASTPQNLGDRTTGHH